MSKLIVWLNEVKEEQASQIGGKGLRLAQLVQANFKVPQAFCLTTAIYQEFLEYNKLCPQLAHLRLDRDKAILQRICRRLSQQILQGKISSKTRDEIMQGVKKIGADRYAVRSSATCEDFHLASFAGQFETYLDILADQLFDGVRKCWASVFSDRVLTYALFHEIELSTVKMAVLVQEMIDAEKGGVIFTKNVIDCENPYVIIIEASTGSADDIVSGLVEPERIVINKKTQVEISRSSPNGRILKPGEIKKLAQMAMKIEDHFQGVPQDIEWVMRGGEAYVLQSRPITT
jgi:pyruvate,water dikinase